MKHVNYLLLCLLLVSTQQISAQLSIGFRGGVSTTSLNDQVLSILDQNGIDNLRLGVKNARYGVHAGLIMQAKLGKFLLQPEVLLNSNKIDYQLRDLSSTFDTLFSEKYQYLDIPLLFGINYKPFRFMAGPVGHIFLQSATDLKNFDGYQQDFASLSLGWQAGLGIDLWKIMIDLRYEGNFNRYGDHFNFFGKTYIFSQQANRLLFSLGYRFGR